MNTIDGPMFLAMLRSGALDLKRHCDEVNNLNVFPVPDGDTGANMLATILGGVEAMEKSKSQSLGEYCNNLRSGSLLAARGNSGVILSQFIAGIAGFLAPFDQANVLQFAQAFEKGVERAYQVVVHPVEGTILTVMREGSEYAMGKLDSVTTFEEYFKLLIEKMKQSLRSTPDLLPILKDAGVIDSGGAGLLYIIEGMGQAIGGKIIEDVSLELGYPKRDTESADIAAFDENSVLDYGYCTEFILQLTNEKGGVESFNLNDAIAYFGTIGDSLVAFRDDNVVKVHVHTKQPDLVIAYALRYGEFVRFKMENMTLQHHQTLIEKSRTIGMLAKPDKEHKSFASVLVAPSHEMEDIYHEAGADEVLVAGKMLNPSTKDFADAIERCDADEVFVFPNNKNQILAAEMAKEVVQAQVHVLPTTNIAEGYSCLSVLDFVDLGLDVNLSRANKCLESSDTFEAFIAARESNLDGLAVTEGDYIFQRKDGKYGKAASLLDAFEQWFAKHAGEEHSLLTIFYSSRIGEEERERLESCVAEQDDFLEIQSFDAGNTLAEICVLLD